MGFGIIRGQKFKIGGLKGMEIHVLRSRPSKSNPDIDLSKTKDNYAIIDVGELNKKVADRIAELPGQKTKTGKTRKIQNNAVMLYDFIITASHEDMEKWDKKVIEQYFKDSVEFIKKHYGEQNIMYAQVHLDERTPHLHLGLVPEYKGKLAAYKLFVPDSMRKLQDDFYAEVSSKYGLERGEVESEAKHKSTVDLKIATIEEVKREQEKLEKIKGEVADEELRREELVRNLQELQIKTEKEKNKLNQKQSEVNQEKENLARLRNDVADAEHQRAEALKILEDLREENEKKKKELEDNKLLADNQEKRFYELYNDCAMLAGDLEKAKKAIKLTEIKETEYNLTNFLLEEAEKELKEENKKIENVREEKNKIIAEIDDKLIKPIIDVALAYEKDKPNLFLKSFKNFAKQALNILPKLQQFKDAKNNDRKIILDKLGISADLKNCDEVEKAYKEMWRDM